MTATAILMAFAGAQSCDATETVLCDSGRRCPTGWTCAADEDRCIQDDCGDGILDRAEGELCDDGNVHGDDSCSADCKKLLGCGNGVLESGETCDDNNKVSGDGCSKDCFSFESCGNNYRDFNEVCDDGNTRSEDGCSADCQTLEFCGDGKRDPGETCDDDNNVSGDRCSADCLSHEVCGNEYQDVEEDCDLGGQLETQTCDSDCSTPACGDGHHNPVFVNPMTDMPEECDDGEESHQCNTNCTLAACGDGIPNPKHMVDPDGDGIRYGEECDDGNDEDTDGCVEHCKSAFCGDSFTHQGVEECDDGEDGDNRDECVADCKLARCGDGHIQRGVEGCDDGDGVVYDNCPDGPEGTCEYSRCGDGFRDVEGQSTEECDDGNMSNEDGCVVGCISATCGDGYIRMDVETCDDGNTSNTDECPSGAGAFCRTARCGDGFIRAGVEACDPAAMPSGCGVGNCTMECTCI